MPWLSVVLALGAAALFAVGAVAQQQEAATHSDAGGAPVGIIWRGRGKTAIASGTRLEFHLLAPVTFSTW